MDGGIRTHDFPSPTVRYQAAARPPKRTTAASHRATACDVQTLLSLPGSSGLTACALVLGRLPLVPFRLRRGGGHGRTCTCITRTITPGVLLGRLGRTPLSERRMLARCATGCRTAGSVAGRAGPVFSVVVVASPSDGAAFSRTAHGSLASEVDSLRPPNSNVSPHRLPPFQAPAALFLTSAFAFRAASSATTAARCCSGVATAKNAS